MDGGGRIKEKKEGWSERAKKGGVCQASAGVKE